MSPLSIGSLSRTWTTAGLGSAPQRRDLLEAAVRREPEAGEERGDHDNREDGAEPEDRARLPALGVAVRGPASPLLLGVGPVAILVLDDLLLPCCASDAS